MTSATATTPTRLAAARVREQPEVRRRMLIAATTRSIAQHGYSGTTIERICAEGQVSRGLINHHFGSKEELIMQAYQQLCDGWTAYTLSGVADTEDPAEALRQCIDKNFDASIFNTGNLRTWLGFWSVIPKYPKLSKLDRALYKMDLKIYRGIFVRLAEARGLRIDADKQATALMALITGLWLHAALDPTTFRAAQAKAICLSSVQHLLDESP
jgi:AcrR family transcriptional regulator